MIRSVVDCTAGCREGMIVQLSKHTCSIITYLGDELTPLIFSRKLDNNSMDELVFCEYNCGYVVLIPFERTFVPVSYNSEITR